MIKRIRYWIYRKRNDVPHPDELWEIARVRNPEGYKRLGKESKTFPTSICGNGLTTLGNLRKPLESLGKE